MLEDTKDTATNQVKLFDFFGLRDFSLPEDQQLRKSAEPTVANDVAEEIIEEAPPPPPPPIFTQQDIENAKEQGRLEGLHQGQKEGEDNALNINADRQQQLTAAMNQCAQQVQIMHQDYVQKLSDHTQDLTALALAVAQKVVGDTLKDNISASIQMMVLQCLPALVSQPKITVKLHPDVAEDFAQHIPDITAQSGFKGGLTVETSPEMSPADCQLSWGSGQAVRSLDNIWYVIRDRLLAEPIGEELFNAIDQGAEEEDEPEEELLDEETPLETADEHPTETQESEDATPPNLPLDANLADFAETSAENDEFDEKASLENVTIIHPNIQEDNIDEEAHIAIEPDSKIDDNQTAVESDNPDNLIDPNNQNNHEE